MVFRYPSFSQWPHAGQIWGCLLGVWMLSEGVRMVSECVRQMSEVCRCHINWKKFDYCHTNYMRPLLPVPIFVQKRPHGRNFQGGVVGFISGSTAVFYVLGGQVMDIGKQWGWCWRIFLTWPRYPPTLLQLVRFPNPHYKSVGESDLTWLCSRVNSNDIWALPSSFLAENLFHIVSSFTQF